MIPVFKVPLPKVGHALVITEGVAGATTNIQNPKHTDIYTNAFPDGLTIDLDIDAFLQLWISCFQLDKEDLDELVEEEEVEEDQEYEIKITMKPKEREYEDGSEA